MEEIYLAARSRTRRLFGLITTGAYNVRPIPLRHPFVFYDGHLPAFAVNTLLRRAKGSAGLDARLEALFARGIDPETAPTETAWPSRDEVRAYADRAEAIIAELMRRECRDARLREAAWAVIEHELMHHETLVYMLRELPYELRRQAGEAGSPRRAGQLELRPVAVPAGSARLGVARGKEFVWDNEGPAHRAHVDAFRVASRRVTNGDWLEEVALGGRPSHFWVRDGEAWRWRGIDRLVELPLAAPVWVTHEQATAYARRRGARLPTEPEYQRYSEGAAPDGGCFDFRSWEPCPSSAGATSRWGVGDLIGSGWEWTSTRFAPFPGFRPLWCYPEYSSDFFDGRHYVMKGASPVTAQRLVRPSFRNWFRAGYPYVFATFRCVI